MNEKSSISTTPLPPTNLGIDVPNVALAPAPTSHPRGFYYIFFGEFAERCSYYGMRAIMPLYLTMVLRFEDSQASEIYSYFKAACYLLPLLGGFLADRYFGKYWTIVGFSVPYVLGHFVLGIQESWALILAMFLLAGGSGVIKPNISTLMGMTYDQQRPGQTALRTSAFSWFYFSINIGAFISMLSLPLLRDALKGEDGNLSFAYKITFQVPAWLMVAALAIFAAGKRNYAVEVIDRTKRITPQERAERWSVLVKLFGIFGLIVFFWVAYEQNDNLWTFFARDHIDRRLFGKEYPPDGFQFINALLILVFVPSFAIMWRTIDPQGTRFPAPTKMLLGFLFTAGASGIMSAAAFAAVGDQKVSAWWIVIAYVVLTIGEILVYGTGLELSFTAAPANMKSFITACFLVTNFLGNMINTRLSPLYVRTIPAGEFFAMSAGIVLVAAVAFYFVGRRFNRADVRLAPDYASRVDIEDHQGITADPPGPSTNQDEGEPR
jgi:POT family proton-dependent oligopeptide transporter